MTTTHVIWTENYKSGYGRILFETKNESEATRFFSTASTSDINAVIMSGRYDTEAGLMDGELEAFYEAHPGLIRYKSKEFKRTFFPAYL